MFILLIAKWYLFIDLKHKLVQNSRNRVQTITSNKAAICDGRGGLGV